MNISKISKGNKKGVQTGSNASPGLKLNTGIKAKIDVIENGHFMGAVKLLKFKDNSCMRSIVNNKYQPKRALRFLVAAFLKKLSSAWRELSPDPPTRFLLFLFSFIYFCSLFYIPLIAISAFLPFDIRMPYNTKKKFICAGGTPLPLRLVARGYCGTCGVAHVPFQFFRDLTKNLR